VRTLRAPEAAGRPPQQASEVDRKRPLLLEELRKIPGVLGLRDSGVAILPDPELGSLAIEHQGGQRGVSEHRVLCVVRVAEAVDDVLRVAGAGPGVELPLPVHRRGVHAVPLACEWSTLEPACTGKQNVRILLRLSVSECRCRAA
jgi:hypothetical protein